MILAGRRKKKKGKSRWFSLGSSKRGRSRRTSYRARASSVLSGFKVTLIILACLCVLAAIAIGFVYLDKYVRTTSPVSYRIGLLELINAPEWISDELLEAVASAAGGKEFALDKGSAKFIAENLSQFEWLYNVQVRTTEKTLRVEAKYRRPLAVVNFSRAESRYLVWPGIDDPVFSFT